MDKAIKSHWRIKKGQWDDLTNKFKNITIVEETKILNMTIEDSSAANDSRKIIVFEGGPTGFERYYIDDLLNHGENISLCLCAGTINRWAECHVDMAEVSQYIKQYLEKVE